MRCQRDFKFYVNGHELFLSGVSDPMNGLNQRVDKDRLGNRPEVSLTTAAEFFKRSLPANRQLFTLDVKILRATAGASCNKLISFINHFIEFGNTHSHNIC